MPAPFLIGSALVMNSSGFERSLRVAATVYKEWSIINVENLCIQMRDQIRIKTQYNDNTM